MIIIIFGNLLITIITIAVIILLSGLGWDLSKKMWNIKYKRISRILWLLLVDIIMVCIAISTVNLWY